MRAMGEYNEDVIVRGYLARSDQDRHLSSLKSASRFAKGFIASGVGIVSSAIIGLYWNSSSVGLFIAPVVSGPRQISASASAFDVVDGARSRHRGAIGWFVGDESHEGSRPHANYHDRFGYRQERVSDSRH